jgi:hypothetical protein
MCGRPPCNSKPSSCASANRPPWATTSTAGASAGSAAGTETTSSSSSWSSEPPHRPPGAGPAPPRAEPAPSTCAATAQRANLRSHGRWLGTVTAPWLRPIFSHHSQSRIDDGTWVGPPLRQGVRRVLGAGWTPAEFKKTVTKPVSGNPVYRPQPAWAQFPMADDLPEIQP